jgi:hypothetical protein
VGSLAFSERRLMSRLDIGARVGGARDDMVGGRGLKGGDKGGELYMGASQRVSIVVQSSRVSPV